MKKSSHKQYNAYHRAFLAAVSLQDCCKLTCFEALKLYPLCLGWDDSSHTDTCNGRSSSGVEPTVYLHVSLYYGQVWTVRNQRAARWRRSEYNSLMTVCMHPDHWLGRHTRLVRAWQKLPLPHRQRNRPSSLLLLNNAPVVMAVRVVQLPVLTSCNSWRSAPQG